jgi:FecR protein
MIKRLLLGGLAVIVVAGVGFFALAKHNKTADVNGQTGTDGSENQALKPTIQITTPSAYLIADDGSKTELKDGDTITPPATIELSDKGAASINLPDGSTARIMYGTKFTLTKADYDATTGKANTGFFLSVGRIWSKVVELATPDSSWEVQTSNAVATVRGTAFDSEADAEGSMFVGSEHQVTVDPIDPKTGEPVKDKGLGVGEGTLLKIKAKILADILAGKGKLATSTISDDEKNTNWHQGNEKEDQHVNDVLKELRDRGVKGKDLQKEIRERLRKEIEDLIKKDMEDGVIRPATEKFIDLLNSTSTPPKPKATSTKPDTGTTPPPTPPASTAKTVSVDVVVVGSFSGIVEHTPVKFKAIAKLADGTTRDVTAKADWKVLGQIGRFTAPGTLFPELDPLIAEQGKGSGAVIATYNDPNGGGVFLGKTIIFDVAADVGNGDDGPIDGS